GAGADRRGVGAMVWPAEPPTRAGAARNAIRGDAVGCGFFGRGARRRLMSARLHTIRRVLGRFWRGLREWCGDAAYERYLHSCAQQNGARKCTMSAEEFYVEQLNRRYSRPNRCC